MRVLATGGAGFVGSHCVRALQRAGHEVEILDDLSRGQPAQPPRPWLGVMAQDDGEHVVVVGVNPRSPAARAELRAGDVILAVGDQGVGDLEDFYSALWAAGPAGTVIPLTLQRDGDVFDVEIRSADRAAMLKKPRFN